MVAESGAGACQCGSAFGMSLLPRVRGTRLQLLILPLMAQGERLETAVGTYSGVTERARGRDGARGQAPPGSRSTGLRSITWCGEQ